MKERNISVQVGPGFCGTLFIVFLVLKLTSVIDWSYWWVTAPLWLPLAIGGSFVLFCLLIVIIGSLLKA